MEIRVEWRPNVPAVHGEFGEPNTHHLMDGDGAGRMIAQRLPLPWPHCGQLLVQGLVARDERGEQLNAQALPFGHGTLGDQLREAVFIVGANWREPGRGRAVALEPTAEPIGEPVPHGGTCTADLDALAGWLLDCGVTTGAMASTGVSLDAGVCAVRGLGRAGAPE